MKASSHENTKSNCCGTLQTAHSIMQRIVGVFVELRSTNTPIFYLWVGTTCEYQLPYKIPGQLT